MDKEFKILLSELMLKVGELIIQEEKQTRQSKLRLLKSFSPNNSRLTTKYKEQEKSIVKTLIFNEKEVSSMPKDFKKVFILKGCVVSCRLRNDKHCRSYELRYRKDGYNISASGRTLELAKYRFLDKIQHKQTSKKRYPTKFNDFAVYFCQNYLKKKVSDKWFEKIKNYLTRDILPKFNHFNLCDISPEDCQQFIDGILNEGKGKKAEDIKGILNQVFTYAIKLSVLSVNPISLIVYHKHERKHGQALTKEEESLLLSATSGTPYCSQFAIALYTGLRPNEFKTAKIQDNFIIAVNSKRKGGKTEFKKIPIIPMLKPFIAEFKRFYGANRLYEKLKEVLPTHKLYDLRTTFFNRCIECEVIESVRDSWLGHNSTNIKESYTDISIELHLRESEKLSYFLP